MPSLEKLTICKGTFALRTLQIFPSVRTLNIDATLDTNADDAIPETHLAMLRHFNISGTQIGETDHGGKALNNSIKFA